MATCSEEVQQNLLSIPAAECLMTPQRSRRDESVSPPSGHHARGIKCQTYDVEMLTEHFTITNHLVEDPFPSGADVYMVVLEQDPATINTIRGTVSPDGFSAILEDSRFVYLPEGMTFSEKWRADNLAEEFRRRLRENQSSS